MERVTIFIDGSNFYHGLKANNCPTRIDFYKLSKLLTGQQRSLIRTYYYNAAYNQSDDPPEYASQLSFLTKLRKTSYLAVKLGRLEKRITKIDQEILRQELGDKLTKKFIKIFREKVTNYIEKGVDIAIASDMLKFAYSDSYDTAMLISGDGDFVSALEGVQNLGKHVENAYFNKGHSIYLRETCDRFISLTSNSIKKCLHTK